MNQMANDHHDRDHHNNDCHDSVSTDSAVATGDGLDRYLDALSEVDPMKSAVPAEALADLLAARLEHRNAPEARAVLESLIGATARPAPRQDHET